MTNRCDGWVKGMQRRRPGLDPARAREGDCPGLARVWQRRLGMYLYMARTGARTDPAPRPALPQQLPLAQVTAGVLQSTLHCCTVYTSSGTW